VLNRDALEDLADSAVFQRGEAYFARGAVRRMRATAERLTARVAGSDMYDVELRCEGGQLVHDCSCPHAAEGNFCKHCVATGLAWLAERESAERSGSPPDPSDREDPWRKMEAFLETQPKQMLIALLLEVAQRDDRLHDSLLLKGTLAAGGDGTAAIASFRRAIDEATSVDDFIDWRQVRTYGSRLDQIIESLEELLDHGAAAALVHLTEHATRRIEDSLDHVDDSHGVVGEVLQRVGELHRAACVMARPDPERLANRLFELAMTLPVNVHGFDPVAYRRALGARGLKRYRELAEEALAAASTVSDADGSRHHRARRILLGLAAARGDVETVARIEASNLSHDHRYLHIAEIWARAGQRDKALDWAERGLAAFPDRPSVRLREFLISTYSARKQFGKALPIAWALFAEHPGLDRYVQLQRIAAKLHQWPQLRQRAHDHLARRDHDDGRRPAGRHGTTSAADRSVRLEIALWERDLDAASSVADEGAVGLDLLVKLAGELETSRPDDAVGLYRRVIPPLVERMTQADYESAARLVRAIGRLMMAQGKGAAFAEFLGELHARYRAKRNFIRLLDGIVVKARAR